MGVGGVDGCTIYRYRIVLYSMVLISYLVDVITCFLSRSGGKKRKEGTVAIILLICKGYLYCNHFFSMI